MKRTSIVGLIVVAMATMAILAVPATAQLTEDDPVERGISTVPGIIEIDDALRGSTLFRPLTLFNATEIEQAFEITFRGDAAAWLSVVDPADETTVVTELTDPDGSGVSALIRIEIPGDVPIGDIEGQVVVRLAPVERDDDDTGVAVALGIIIPVRLTVTGDQVIAASIEDVSIGNTEVGLPLRAVIAIANEGNTQVNPEFTLEILKDGQPVSTAITANLPSFPGEQKSFEVRWDTTGAEPGVYTARISTTFADLDLGTEERTFELLPEGTISRLLVFEDLQLNGEARAGGLTGLTATVQNPGQADTRGTLVGELTQGGNVVSTFESPPFLVAGGETLPIPINLETPDEAEYSFTARIVYGDAETETKAVTFTAVPAATEAQEEGTDASSSVPWGAIAVGIGLIVLVGLAIWFFARRRANGAVPPPAEEEDPETATVTSDT